MLAGFSVRKPYTIVVVVILIMLLGCISLYNMSADLLPSLNLPFAVIVVPLIGATPEEVEARVTRPVEQALASTANISNINSISSENVAMVMLEFSENANMDSIMIEMRENLDMLAPSMPEQAGSPMILKLNPDMMPVMVVSAAVVGQRLAESSHFLETTVIPELESIEGIASVTASGLIQEEIYVRLNHDKIKELADSFQAIMGSLPLEMFLSSEEIALLEEFQADSTFLSKDMITGIIAGQNISMPVGYVYTDGTEYLVRVGEQIESLEELENLAVFSIPFPGVQPVVLGDIADIFITDNSDDTYARVNNNDAIMLAIQKQPDYVTADLARTVRAKIADLERDHQGLAIIPLMDQGEYIDLVVNNMGKNLIYGGLLAVLILLLFLGDFKPTLVVGFSIPISLITAFVFMYFSKVSLNIISMGGLALGVGMLVDNSIVVMENIYRLRGEGMEAKAAAIKGASQVAGAIVASTLTTISVFLPIVFTGGLTRQIFTDMGLTIAYALLASLLIALTLIPMMSSRLLEKKRENSDKKLNWVLHKYTGVLNFSLKHKGVVLITILILFTGSIIGAFSQGTELFPASNMDQLSVTVTLPVGTSFTESTAIAEELTEIIAAIEAVEIIGAAIGGDMFGRQFMGNSGRNTISYYILLREDRQNTSNETARLIREKTADMAYTVRVMDMGMDMSALTGGDIVINIKGRNLGTLETIAREVAKIIAGVEGTIEVSDGLESTVPEYRVLVDKNKSIGSGLTTGQLMMEIAAYLRQDSPVTTLTIGMNDYGVRVVDDQKPKTLAGITSLNMATPMGDPVAIGDLVTVTEAEGFSSIQRENQQRYISVTADVEAGYNIGLVSEEIQARLSGYELPPGYTLEMGGEIELITNTFNDLYIILALGIAFIYLIMVAQFQSLLSPFIVMFTIPLAFTGGFFALILTGSPLSIVAFIGLIILAGVVVNNGIVFIDYINILRRSGFAKKDAIIKAGTDRFRPIIMTALTTVFALSTMAIGLGTGAEMIQPMAITAIGGLVYATILTLILVPVLYDGFNKG